MHRVATTVPTVPGPRGLPIIGAAPSVARDPYGSLAAIARQYGDVASVPLPGLRLVLINHPDHVRHVMTTRASIYPKPALFRDVLFREPPRFHGMANGDEWRRVRRLLNPKFTERGLAPLAELMIDTIVGIVDSWSVHARSGEAIDIQEEFSILTMSVMLRTMFTAPTERAEVARLADAFADLMRGMAVTMLTTGLPESVPRPYRRATAAAKAAIFDYIDRMVAARRRGAGGDACEGDLLGMVLGAEFEDGTPMTDEHVRRELMGLIIGGYETTAAVMSWVVARLPSAAEARARAYAEVDGAVGDRRVEAGDSERLPWLRACFDEAQRMQGFPLNAREATEDDEIGGYFIPAGTTVGVSGYAIHHDPRFWRDPLRFDPRRFLEDEIDKYAFLPFGVGQRRCLGMRMGYMVGLYTLATALQRYEFEPPPGWTPRPRFSFSTIVRGGVPVRLRERVAR